MLCREGAKWTSATKHSSPVTTDKYVAVTTTNVKTRYKMIVIHIFLLPDFLNHHRFLPARTAV